MTAPAFDLESTFVEAGLSDERRRLVTERARDVLILAGPGAGKTRLLTMHAAWLAATSPGRVVLLTFGRRAAAEMERRARELVRGATRAAGRIVARTIHAHALDLLRTHGHREGISPALEILDDPDLERLAIDVARSLGRPAPAEGFSRKFAQFRRLGSPLDALEVEWRSFVEALEARMKSDGVVDHGGSIAWMTRLLDAQRQVRESIQWHDRAVLLDEAQDCDPSQLAFVDRLLGPDSHLFVAMDPDQSLYGWRDADPERVLEWVERREPLRVQLTENHRCKARIAALACRVLDEAAQPAPTNEGIVRLLALPDRAAEARFILSELGDLRREAVLARASWRLDDLRAALLAERVPVRSGQIEWTPAEQRVLEVLAVLVACSTGLEGGSAASLPPEFFGLSAARRQELEARALGEGVHPAELVTDPAWRALIGAARQLHTPRDWVRRSAEALGFEAEDVGELLRLAHGLERLGDLVRRARTGPSPDGNGRSDALLVTTFHGAKGLEFDKVYIVGCEDGVVPDRRALESVKKLREERRALYVGLTRAADEVVLTWARADGRASRRLSPFLPDGASGFW